MKSTIVERCATLAAVAMLLGGCGSGATAPAPASLLSAGETTQATAGYNPGLPLPPGPSAIGSLRMMTPLRGWALGPPGKGKTGTFDVVLGLRDRTQAVVIAHESGLVVPKSRGPA